MVYFVARADEQATETVASTAATGATHDTTTGMKRITAQDEYTLSYAFRSMVSGGTQIELGFDGKLLRGELSSNDASRVVRVQIDGTFDLKHAGQAVPPATLAQLEQQLRQPFFVEYAASGQVQALRLSPKLERVVQTTLRAIVTTLQFVRPAEQDLPTAWQQEERDSSGVYLASYSAKGPDGAGLDAFQKQKVKYTESFGAATTAVLESKALFELATGDLRDVQLEERMRVEPTGSMVVGMGPIETHVTLTLRWQTRLEGRVASDQFRSYERLGLEEVGTEEAKIRDLDRAMMAGHAYEEVVAALLTPADTTEQKQAQTRAYRAITAMLRADPKLVSDLEQRIARGDSGQTTWIAALRDAGTPEAQQALLRLVDDSQTGKETRMELVRALSLVDHPLVEATAMLRTLVADPTVGEQAILGLGSHAKRLADGHEDASALMADLLRRHAEATTPVERDRYMTALGNSGQRDALPAIDKVLEGSDQNAMGTAVEALRRIPGDDVDARLVEALASPDVRARERAARAIRDRRRTSVLVAGLAAAIRTEQHVLVQNALVQTAALWAKEAPTILASLAWLADNAANENVRLQAKAVVESIEG